MSQEQHSTDWAKRNSRAVARGYASATEERKYRAAYRAAGVPAPARKSRSATVAAAVRGARREQLRRERAHAAGFATPYQERKSIRYRPELPPKPKRRGGGVLGDDLRDMEIACWDWYAPFSMSPRSHFDPDGDRRGHTREDYIRQYYRTWVAGPERYKLNRNGSDTLRRWFDSYLDPDDLGDFVYSEHY